ncbi:MAG: hypothetical protein AAGA30_06685 [Planctomycetota bacterium]
MLRKELLPTLIILVSFLVSSLDAQTIDLTVDQSQSFVDIFVLGGKDQSSISGDAKLELSPLTEPFSTARLTELNMSMADGFSISLLAGAAVVGVDPGQANVFFTEVGPAGAVNGSNQFDQVGNIFGVSGMSMIETVFGDEMIDLATVKPVPFDIMAAQLASDGELLTLSASVKLDFDFEILGGIGTMTLSGPIVLTGTLPNKTILGDVNCDGDVNLLDVAPFVDLIANGGFSEKADVNLDGVVDLLDVQPFVDLLAG